MSTAAKGADLTFLGLPSRARPEWRSLGVAIVERGPAACEQSLDIEAWWPRATDDAASAVLVCRVCPVRAECAAYAIAAREREGVWGGLTPAERGR